MSLEEQLIESAKKGDIKEVRSLLEEGADVNAISCYNAIGCYHYNETPIHKAAIKDYTEIVKLFLEYGVDVEIKNRNGETPLHSAVMYNHTEIVWLLLKHGANVETKNLVGGTPLHEAARNGCKKVIVLLLIYGAILHDDVECIINNKSDLKNCLEAFNKIKELLHLGKLIEANIKKEGAQAIASYINNEAKGQKLIEEFKGIQERYGSDEALSFMPECLLDFIKHLSKQYLPKHKKDAFRTGAIAELLRLVLQKKGNFDLNKKIEIQDYGFIEGSNDALNLSVVCKSINIEARQHANINLKKCERKITTLLTQLKGIELLSKYQCLEV